MTSISEPLVESILIAAEPQTVFEFFVDPTQMRKWMGGHVVLEPRPGGAFAVDIGNNHARGSFVEVQAPERVVFTWGWEGSEAVPPGSSTVTFTFESVAGGTLVRMMHGGLPASEIGLHHQGWLHYFSRLALAAVGVDPGPDSQMED